MSLSQPVFLKLTQFFSDPDEDGQEPDGTIYVRADRIVAIDRDERFQHWHRDASSKLMPVTILVLDAIDADRMSPISVHEPPEIVLRMMGATICVPDAQSAGGLRYDHP